MEFILYLNSEISLKADEITWQVTIIFNSKKYEDAPMRGRTSFDPIEKMGLAALSENKICITDMGGKFLSGEIEIGDVMLAFLLKFQYPNPLMDGFTEYNTRPFVNTLRIIKKVNELCVAKNVKAKGISKDEFGIFILSFTDFEKVDEVSNLILDYRKKTKSLKTQKEKDEFKFSFINSYLQDFNNPQENVREYTDNMIRCLRLTKYIYIHEGGFYIDLESRRAIEINSILEDLDGSADFYNKEAYYAFMGDYEGYTPPFENPSSLEKIATSVIDEIHILEKGLGKEESDFTLKNSQKDLKKQVEDLRAFRLDLQNEKLKFDYSKSEKIDEAIFALKNIRSLDIKPSIALEKWTNIALNIIDDCKKIKPNSPLGDDNEPTYTAPAKVPDIECFYETFNSICEVTMLSGRDQWFNEGQPVMRHLRDFENQNSKKSNYCLFIAPQIHTDTINTFWVSVKYEYEGRRQKIIPITISQLIKLLESAKRNKIAHTEIQSLFEKCADTGSLKYSSEWKNLIDREILNFCKK